jgi:hypothetical protein
VDALFAQYWQDPDDTALLRVWADSLLERGELRGEYIQLCSIENPSEQQRKRRATLETKSNGKLVGPARPFLREWSFGPNGLVDRARCEADKLAAGLDHIASLNPRLSLNVTSLRKPPIAALAKLSLERIYHVSFAYGVIGSQGGSNIADPGLIALAPALRRVRHLSLKCAGYADDCFTPEGLRHLGRTVEALEMLVIAYYRAGERPYENATRPRLPPIDDYARVIASEPGFRTLKAVFLRGCTQRALLEALPDIARIETVDHDTPGAWCGAVAAYPSPAFADEIEAVKRR